jgi:hypothetical protein
MPELVAMEEVEEGGVVGASIGVQNTEGSKCFLLFTACSRRWVTSDTEVDGTRARNTIL